MSRSLLIVLISSACAFAAEHNFDFSQTAKNELPAGFRSVITGKGTPGEWRIRQEEVPPLITPFLINAQSANKQLALAQLSQDPNDSRAPMLIFDGESYSDFTFTTRFKIVSGEVEQMAGIAFRVQDERNYYYVRANAKNQNVAFFRYVEGELIGPVAVTAEVKRDQWHQMTIECRGNKFRGLLDEKEVIPWTEPALVPFPDGTSKGVFPNGKIAFWTKADTVAYFTETRVEYKPRVAFAQTLVRETLQQNPRLLGLKVFGVPKGETVPRIIGSDDEKEIGTLGEQVEKDCIEKGGSYFGRGKELVLVTMALHDRNGETVGAVRLVLTTFLGQTEKNALARALPIVKWMEARVVSSKEFLE